MGGAHEEGGEAGPAQELARVLGFRDLLFIAMGQIIGAGVVALTGVAIGMTGPAVVLAYPAAALLSIAVALPIVIAGGALPTIGGYYVWCARLGSAWMGSGVLMLILLASISLGLYGSSFGLYLSPIFPVLSPNGWGVVVLLALFGANLFGLRMAAGVQSALVLVLLSALALYAGFAMPRVELARLDPLLPKGAFGFLSAVFLLKFATGGAHLVVGLGGEVEDAERTLPRVMIWATVIVSAFYAAIALAAVGVVPWREMIDQPLTLAGRAFLPGWALTYFLVGGAGIAIGTTLNAQFIQLPRNFMVAAWDGLLPESIGRLNRFGAPWVILTIMATIGLVPLVLGLDISAIARATSIAATLPAFFVYWAVTRIPAAHPERYARSILRPSPIGMGVLFVFSELMATLGVILLGRDLPAGVALGLAAAAVLAFGWYPIRKRVLARRGIDLDARMRDPAILLGGPGGSEPMPSGD
ncbi:MAG: APC family permease [Myxococcota bacterium]